VIPTSLEPLSIGADCLAWKQEQRRQAMARRPAWEKERRMRADLALLASYNVNGPQRVGGVPADWLMAPVGNSRRIPDGLAQPGPSWPLAA